jgi:hypothetical protein
MHERRAHAAQGAVQGAGARLAQRGRDRRLQHERLASAAHPLRVRVAQQIVERTTAALRGAYAGQMGYDLALDVPALEVAPGRDQDFVRQELLRLFQPAKQLAMAPDEPRFGEDAHEPRPVIRIQARHLLIESSRAAVQPVG